MTRIWPLPALADGRPPQVTSGFGPRGVLRRHHDGVDLLYRYLRSDPSVKAGDGGAVVRKGLRRWWIPPGTEAICTEDGIVTRVHRLTTGWRVWVWHEASEVSTGYFHLRAARVQAREQVRAGQQLGPVGDNPAVDDPVHLHFEVLTGRAWSRAKLQDPARYLEGAEILRGSR